MTTDFVANELVNLLTASPGVAAAFRILDRAILRILADGRPAAVKELAAVVGRPADEVAGLVAELPNVERDSRGRVLGFGLSFIPTPHRVYLEGRDHVLYAWCAPDALILPGRIGLSARVVSPCHATKQPVTVTVGPEGVGEVRPPGAVVSWWPSAMDSRDIRGTSCVNQVLFSSGDAAQSWLTERPGATVMPVADAFRVTTRVADQTGLVARETS